MKDSNRFMVRQGDVLLVRIEKLPSGLKIKDNVLAYGEVTGHRHRFKSGAVAVYADEDDPRQQYCKVKEEAELVHDTHAPITVVKGVYKVVIQREFDLVEGIRQVMD